MLALLPRKRLKNIGLISPLYLSILIKGTFLWCDSSVKPGSFIAAKNFLRFIKSLLTNREVSANIELIFMNIYIEIHNLKDIDNPNR